MPLKITASLLVDKPLCLADFFANIAPKIVSASSTTSVLVCHTNV
jgi:hypothetical protein